MNQPTDKHIWKVFGMGQNEFYIDIKYPSHRVEKAINWHRD